MPDALLKPLELGPLHLRNRIIMSSLTRNRAVPTNVPNDFNLEYYAQRAEGGAGLIFAEGTLISQQGTEWPNAPGIWNEEQTVAWKKITEAVHAADGQIFAQLWHVGRVGHPDAPEQQASGSPVYAPSAVSARGGKFRFLPGAPGYVTPTALDDPQIIIEQFKNAATNAKKAGFDGLDLHGANGYIIHQFLDTSSNKRTDKWGGSVENRSRLGLEVLKVLIEVFGADRVGIKLSPGGGYNDMGMSLQDTLDTFGYFITEANNLKLAYITLSRYSTAFAPVFDGVKRGTDHDLVASYKHLITHPKLILNGGLTPDEAEQLIASGKIDAAMFGSLWIPHPDLAKRIQYGKPIDVQIDWPNVYGHGPSESNDQRKGYSDYQALQYD